VIAEDEFAALAERHRTELRVHCYRMLGSYDEAEDLVQETFLRAWKHRADFEGRGTVRAWLYRIATNACLDALTGRSRRVLPDALPAPASWDGPRTDVPWLQPLPDRLSADDPESTAIARETIELAFLAAIQHLPPRQRAVLILRDVLGWPATQAAAVLAGSVASANSALQRARATLARQLPSRRVEWPSPVPTEAERAVLLRYMAAVERADLAALADLLAEEVRTTMPPFPMWFAGRDAVLAALAAGWDPGSPDYVGRFRMVAVGANRQPAAAAYVRAPGAAAYEAFAISLLRIRDGLIVEATAFHDPGLFAAFGLPMTFGRPDRPNGTDPIPGGN
jgi:RNA polymerase sigma-70 factor, ECF subfamily